MNNFSQNNLKNFILSQARPPIIVCIGSPKAAGDCFGPLTGQLLSDFFDLPSPVYGSLEKPVHALNLIEQLQQIKFCHPDRKIIALDSALSDSNEIGSVRFFVGPIKPGLALKKRLPAVGDFSITATIGNDSRALFDADYGKIYSLALRTALAIRNAFPDSRCRVASNTDLILRR